jgi:hypothetical protein
MSKSTTRALALSSSDEPSPPRRQANALAGLAPVLIIAGFLPGLIIGVALGSPPPPPDRCDSASDVIACLIQSND